MVLLKLLISSITTKSCKKLFSTPLQPEGPKSQLWPQQKTTTVFLDSRFRCRGVEKSRNRLPMLHGDQYFFCFPCSVGMQISIFSTPLQWKHLIFHFPEHFQWDRMILFDSFTMAFWAPQNAARAPAPSPQRRCKTHGEPPAGAQWKNVSEKPRWQNLVVQVIQQSWSNLMILDQLSGDCP